MEYKNLIGEKITDKLSVYNCDCMELLKQTPDNYYSLALVDPPYGIGEAAGKNASRNKGFGTGNGKSKKITFSKDYGNKDWDNSAPDLDYFTELKRVSKNQIVFGANYFLEYLPSTRGFVCWDKKQEMPTLSACELVWTSLDKPAKIMRKSSTDLNRFHPTQKPIYVYEWMFNYCKLEKGDKILDTHLGSGSSRIAAYKANLPFIGCELDADYFHASVKRF